MERLTSRNENGRAIFAGNDTPVGNVLRIGDILERLAEYEETGLEPKDCNAFRAFMSEAISKGVSFNRIIELIDEEHERLEHKPLSPEELRQMIGEPVWVVYLPVVGGEWEVVDEWTLAHMDEFVAYRYKPAKEEL